MRRARVTPWHFHPAHPDVVVPRRVDPTGRHGPTPDMARGGRWRRLGGGWYVDAGAARDRPDQRVVEAAVHLPERSAVTGWAALHWQGARCLDGVVVGHEPRPVPLAVGLRNVRSREGLLVSKERMSPSDLVVEDGLRITSAASSVLFEMRHAASVRAAVRFGDLAALADLVSAEELELYVRDHLGGRTGVEQARRAVALMSESAWSPTEVDMRMAWIFDAGLPVPLANRPVFDERGRHLFTPDLIDPASWVVGEYDGASFHSGARRGHDLDRDDLVRSVGLEPVTMVAADRRDTSAFVRRLLAARDRAAARRGGRREWTVDPPAWWIRTDSVAQRRALGEADRARLPGRRTA